MINRVLSGITPSGSALHIGNYFGAVKPQVELQEKIDETFYFIADLHALTTVQDKGELEKNIVAVVLDYLSLGLDPEKSIFFRQSDVPEHSQLAVVLANFVSLGHMKRMHAFKDKLQKGEKPDSINMGLFNYPILMAADILLYKPDGVPVGEDQRQHIEITRDIAEKFNKVVKQEVLRLPEPVISKEVGKVVGTDGERKMSKSLGNVIGIFEDEEIIKKQIMSCFTDPNRKKVTDPGKVEGNPVFIYHDLINDDKGEVEDLKNRYRDGRVGDVEVKERLFEAHKRLFEPARKRRKKLEEDMELVKRVLAEGAEKAKKVARETLEEVYEAIGIKNSLSVK
ncbi:tryptophan--tRNA ligase [Patescibacteria group bacterium]|nr:tryptophan--tRNA ligase [Patescibacteria group bacterium]